MNKVDTGSMPIEKGEEISSIVVATSNLAIANGKDMAPIVAKEEEGKALTLPRVSARIPPPIVVSSDEKPTVLPETQEQVELNPEALNCQFQLGVFGLSQSAEKRKSRAHRYAQIMVKRQAAEASYCRGDYRSSVQLFTKAIAMYTQENGPTVDQQKSILPILVAHRAAALFMLGAYSASASEFQQILPDDALLTERSTESPSTLNTTYQRFLFMMYVCVGLARACLKLGDHVAAEKSLETALRAIEDATIFFRKANRPDWVGEHAKRVAHVHQEVLLELGRTYHLKMILTPVQNPRSFSYF